MRRPDLYGYKDQRQNMYIHIEHVLAFLIQTLRVVAGSKNKMEQ